MSPASLTTDRILTLLTEGPSRITESTAVLTEAQLHAVPGPGEWSANDVLAHLRSCADVWGSAIMTILQQDNPTIKAVNPRTWIQNTDYPGQKFRPSLKAFTVQRKELLQRLQSLKPKSWLRSAIITGAGKPLERTVLSYAEWMATHERPHVKQIERIARSFNK